MIDNAPLQPAIEKATEAFWKSLAEQFPNHPIENAPQEVREKFVGHAEQALWSWMMANMIYAKPPE